MEPVLHTMREELRAIEQKLALYSRSLIGTPYVVKLFPGMYLVPDADGNGYSARGIVDGVTMYSAESAASAVALCRNAYPVEFCDCRAVHIVDALRAEREQLLRLLELCEEATA